MEKLEQAYYIYTTNFLLFMAEQEMKFVMDDKALGGNIKRKFKKIMAEVQNFRDELTARGANLDDIFNEFNTDKVNAIHNTMVLMLGMEIEETQDIETYIENLVKKKMEAKNGNDK